MGNETKQEKDLTFVVIFAKYENKYIIAKQKTKDVWEYPGGHIELGENPIEAAKRELYEETGAISKEIHPIFDYEYDGKYGRVFSAEVGRLETLPEDFEMEKIALVQEKELPKETAYPDIYPVLLDIYKRMQKGA